VEGILIRMIEVKFFKPEKTASWLVKQYEIIQSTVDTKMEDKFVPRSDTSLVFHFKALPEIAEPLNLILPQFFVVPLISKANTIKISGELDTFIVTCHPSVLSSVFHLDMSPDPKISISLPRELFFPLWKKLKPCKSTQQRITLFNQFLETIQSEPYKHDLIDHTYNNIIHSCIIQPLPLILKETPKSLSVIQRNFIKRVGISPKTLTRIVRANYLIDKIKENNVINYQDLVFDGHYYDQSHFIKDFKAITGETPGFYFKRNLRLTNILSGKNVK